MLPKLIRQFSKIKDPRRPGSVEHTTTVLLMYGLFLFLFRISSRREANATLSRAYLSEKLREVFPEFETIPHACTLSRFLEKTDPLDLEKIHVSLIQNLIQKKKFRKLLIQGHLPISIDGTQKITRDGLLNDPHWSERSLVNKDQQYIIVVEANLTFKNGLNIPLMTEYVFNDPTSPEDDETKQDSETEGTKRLIQRLKSYFKRLKIIIVLDSLYPTKPMMQLLYDNHFQFMIKLPKKVKALKELLDAQSIFKQVIPEQPYYRERKQVFHWVNGVRYFDNNQSRK
jgi:hypothetical protein